MTALALVVGACLAPAAHAGGRGAPAKASVTSSGKRTSDFQTLMTRAEPIKGSEFHVQARKGKGNRTFHLRHSSDSRPAGKVTVYGATMRLDLPRANITSEFSQAVLTLALNAHAAVYGAPPKVIEVKRMAFTHLTDVENTEYYKPQAAYLTTSGPLAGHGYTLSGVRFPSPGQAVVVFAR